jgi:hypothetical protein
VAAAVLGRSRSGVQSTELLIWVEKFTNQVQGPEGLRRLHHPHALPQSRQRQRQCHLRWFVLLVVCNLLALRFLDSILVTAGSALPDLDEAMER